MVEPIARKAGGDFFVGYYLGGWDTKTHAPACFQITIGKEGKKIAPLDMGVCSFSGNPIIFSRVFRGYDPRLPKNLGQELKKQLPDGEVKDNFDRIFRETFGKVAAPLVAAGHKDLPMREAIDFVHHYLHTTIKTTKFMFGAPDCGGAIEVGFITTDRRFRWGCHKGFSSAINEQGYTDNG
jgi:hypothetical protein